MNQRVVIVGAGMIGAAIALELSRRGVSVTVLDAHEPASGCSFGNSGLLSPGHAPLSAPGIDTRFLKNQNDPAASGRFAPSTDPDLNRWIAAFSRSCSPEAYRTGMDALCDLAHLVMPIFREWTKEIGDRCDFRETGALVVATSAESLASLRNYARELHARGLPSELLDAQSVRSYEPAATDAVVGGVYHPDWATIEPHRFATAVMRTAQTLGTTLRTGARATRVGEKFVELQTGEHLEADAVVVATGADAATLLAPLGVDLPMASALGWHADLDLKNPVRKAIVIADRDVILTPIESRLRLSGLVEITMSSPAAPDAERIEQLLRGPGGVLKGITGEIVSTWVGRRPCLPDGLPAIGAVPGCESVYLATGHARMGLTLGPATGRLLAEMICGETISAPVDAFSPSRFASQHA